MCDDGVVNIGDMDPEPRYPSLMHLWTKLRVSGMITDPKVQPDALSLLSKGAGPSVR